MIQPEQSIKFCWSKRRSILKGSDLFDHDGHCARRLRPRIATQKTNSFVVDWRSICCEEHRNKMILQHQFLLVGLFLLMISKRCGSISVDVHSQFLDLPRTESIICYQCTDCPEPFVEAYPYVTKVNNSNFLAQCTVIDRYFDNDSRQTEYF